MFQSGHEGHDENANHLRRLVDLDFEKQAAQAAAGQEENTYGVWGPIWKFMRWYDAKRVPHTFKKKTYLLFMLFTGWAGGLWALLKPAFAGQVYCHYDGHRLYGGMAYKAG